MKEKILVDTNIIIEYLKTGKGILPKVHEKYDMYISISVYIEILSSSTFMDQELKQEVKEFIDKYFKIEFPNQEIIDKTSDIIRSYGTTLASAITAATSIVKGYKLLTDLEEFNNIDGIDFLVL